MKRLTGLAALAGCLAVLGCYRTTYRNFGIPTGTSVTTPAPHPPSWQHFFLWGWVPSERVIPASRICGEGHVKEIRTRQTFLEGLVEQLCSYYVNIYSPYDAEVVCDDAAPAVETSRGAD